ncbi:MAG: MFS transporter, partial [Acidobacteriota bacterium]
SGRQEISARFDFKGAFLSCASLGCLLFGAERIGGHTPWSPWDLLILGLGALIFAVFVLSQLSVEHPLIHLELFRLRNVSVGLGCLFCFTATLASTSFVFPFYLKGVLDLSPSQTGLVLAPYSVALCVLGPVTGWLTARIHPGWMSASGFFVGALVCIVYSQLGGESSFMWVAAGQFGLGLAGASFLSPNRVVVLSSVPEENLGEASALIQCVRFFGLSVGTMMASLVFESLLGPFGGIRELVGGAGGAQGGATSAFLQGINGVFPVTAGLLTLGMFACVWNALNPDRRHLRSSSTSSPKA